jgi:hypothetical protein
MRLLLLVCCIWVGEGAVAGEEDVELTRCPLVFCDMRHAKFSWDHVAVSVAAGATTLALWLRMSRRLDTLGFI